MAWAGSYHYPRVQFIVIYPELLHFLRKDTDQGFIQWWWWCTGGGGGGGGGGGRNFSPRTPNFLKGRKKKVKERERETEKDRELEVVGE